MLFLIFIFLASFSSSFRSPHILHPLISVFSTLFMPVFFAQDAIRGRGVVVRFSSAVHVNISGAFFRCLDDCVKMVKSAHSAHERGSPTMPAADVAVLALVSPLNPISPSLHRSEERV